MVTNRDVIRFFPKWGKMIAKLTIVSPLPPFDNLNPRTILTFRHSPSMGATPAHFAVATRHREGAIRGLSKRDVHQTQGLKVATIVQNLSDLHTTATILQGCKNIGPNNSLF